MLNNVSILKEFDSQQPWIITDSFSNISTTAPIPAMASNALLQLIALAGCTWLTIDGVNGFIVSVEHPLGEVLKKAASLSSAEKIKMKEACKSFDGFDYHSYKDEFSKIFK